MAKQSNSSRMNEAINKILEKNAADSPSPISSQETALYPEGIETLLNIPNRKELPPRSEVGRVSKLETLAYDAPDIYAEFIHHIRMGAFFHVAAEAIGISSSTLKLWLKNARIDIAGQRDSLYSRLYSDIRRATAQARCGVEVAYAALNPAKWLAKGPGSVFGSHWAEPIIGAGGKLLSDGEAQPNTINSIDSALNDPLDVDEVGDESDNPVQQIGMTVMVLSPEEELATLEAQESAGHIQVSEEYKDSLRKQIQR